MATESTRKHRPTIDQIRELQADAAAVARAVPGDARAYARASNVDLVLQWVLGGYAPEMPPGLKWIQQTAAALREGAAPATVAEVFQGLAE